MTTRLPSSRTHCCISTNCSWSPRRALSKPLFTMAPSCRGCGSPHATRREGDRFGTPGNRACPMRLAGKHTDSTVRAGHLGRCGRETGEWGARCPPSPAPQLKPGFRAAGLWADRASGREVRIGPGSGCNDDEMTLDDIADELYGGTPGEFVSTRNAAGQGARRFWRARPRRRGPQAGQTVGGGVVLERARAEQRRTGVGARRSRRPDPPGAGTRCSRRHAPTGDSTS